MKKLIFIISTWSILNTLNAQDRLSDHLYTLAGGTPASAKVEQLSWLVGRWQGVGLGGTIEETWNPPHNGHMTGAFRTLTNENMQFFEFMDIVEVDDSLDLRIKHFSYDMKGWEDADEYVRFPLVKIEERAVYFDGLTLIREETDRIKGYLWVNHGDGNAQEMDFDYTLDQNFGLKTEEKHLTTNFNNMRDFILLLREDFEESQKLSADAMQAIVQDHTVWVEELTEKGLFKGGDGLDYDGAVLKGDEVIDGPFIESKESVGGYYLIQAKDMEHAKEISKGCPTIKHGGSVEVRPIMIY
ncbi:MAG: hypothetical protein KI790_07500 [Cyclobacteriaceae bacterium]|nr:hypothetical protein [Cyclobacteriaceae bacterium HetDA_MAG_MS6]